MGLKITPVSFSASTLIKSADMNTNWSLVQTATNFDGVWNAATNASAQITLEDATISSVNVIRIRASNGSPGRSISINNGKISTDGSGNLIVSSNGANKVISGTTHAYQNFGFITGTGNGTYSLTGGVTLGIFTQKNTSAVSASLSGWTTNGIDCGSSTQFVVIGK